MSSNSKTEASSKNHKKLQGKPQEETLGRTTTRLTNVNWIQESQAEITTNRSFKQEQQGTTSSKNHNQSLKQRPQRETTSWD